MYLIFDTETTGLPRSFDTPPEQFDAWPRLVQLAWEIYDPRAKRVSNEYFLVQPAGFTIPKDAERVHGISTAVALRDGRPLPEALAAFEAALARARVVIAHNLAFDSGVIEAEFHRIGQRDLFAEKVRICTMIASTEHCRIPGPRGFKWPTLVELHSTLFRKAASGSHDAAADAALCAKCFFELKRLGVIRTTR